MHLKPFPNELVQDEDVLRPDQIDIGSEVVVIATAFRPHSEWIEEFTSTITSINHEKRYVALVSNGGREMHITFSMLSPQGENRQTISLISLETSRKYLTNGTTNYRYNLDLDAA